MHAIHSVARSAAVAALTWYMASGVQAQSAASPGCAPDQCFFQVGSTRIAAGLWKDVPCDNTLLSKLDPAQYDPQGGVHSPLNLVIGVCLYEQIARGLAPLPTSDDRGLSPLLRGIDQLQRAQSGPLLPSQRSTAALFEGLLHCRQLDNEAHCFHRAQALASFAQVDLAGLDLSYAEPENDARRLQNIEELASCQSTLLLSSAAAQCGVQLTASDSELTAVADRVAQAVLPSYFGPLPAADAHVPVPPVTALMQRKIADAQAASQGSEQAFQRIQAKNTRVRGAYAQLETRLGANPSGIPAAVGALYEAYKQTLTTVHDYNDFVTRYVIGLFSRGNIDVRDTVADAVKGADETVARLKAPAAQLARVKTDLTALAADPEIAELATLHQACELFCQIYRGRSIWRSNACRRIDETSNPPAQLQQTNTLCDDALERQILRGTSVTASSVCREAGVDLDAPCVETPARTLVSTRRLSPATRRSKP